MKVLVFLYVLSSNGHFVLPEPFTGEDAWEDCKVAAAQVEFLEDDMVIAHCIHVIQGS